MVGYRFRVWVSVKGFGFAVGFGFRCHGTVSVKGFGFGLRVWVWVSV